MGYLELSLVAWEGVSHSLLSVIVAGMEQSRVPGQKTKPITSLEDGIVLPLRRKWNFHHKVAVSQVRFPHGHFLLPAGINDPVFTLFQCHILVSRCLPPVCYIADNALTTLTAVFIHLNHTLLAQAILSAWCAISFILPIISGPNCSLKERFQGAYFKTPSASELQKQGTWSSSCSTVRRSKLTSQIGNIMLRWGGEAQ